MNNLHSALEAIARRDIPEHTDLWPQIAARVERKDKIDMNPRMKLAWTALLVLLGLILVTSAAYAVYRYFNDPGLQNVQDQGLVTHENSTAQPKILPTPTPLSGPPQSAVLLGKEQTLAGVAMTLDWVYLQDSTQAFHVSTQGLGADLHLGPPVMSFMGVTPEQYRGAIFSLDGTPTTAGTYLAYQLVRKNGQFGGNVDLQIDIPLLQGNTTQPTQLGTFHFDLKDIPVIVLEGGGGGNSYAVRVNSLEMRLESTIVTPSYTEARLCYQPPTTDQDWSIQNADIQFVDATGTAAGKPVLMQSYLQVEKDCADVRFPVGKHTGDMEFWITARGLIAGNDPASHIDAAWQFNTVLIDNLYVAGVSPTPTPQPALAIQTVGDLKATLVWAYADANRVALQLHFDGWKKDYGLLQGGLVTDQAGSDLGYAEQIQPSESDPATMILIFNPSDPAVLENVDHVDLKLDIPVFVGSNMDAPFASFHFNLNLKVYPALVLTPGLSATSNGIEVRIEKIKMSPSFTSLYVCFKKPTTGLPSDWGISQESTLQVGEIRVNLQEAGTLFDADYGGYLGKGPKPGDLPRMDGGRCMELGFPLGHRNQAEVMTLSIPRLQINPPEGIPDEQVQAAREKLKAQGIEMDWITASGNGGGGAGPVYKKLPAGMTQEQAYQLFLEALGYFHEGPWVFSLNINP